MIKKITIKNVWVGDEKTLVAKKGPNAGQSFVVCKIGLFTPDDNAEYAGRFIGGSTFPQGKRTAKQVAEDLKVRVASAVDGESMYLDIEESKDGLDKNGKPFLNFKFPSKAAIEAVKPYIK